MMYNSINQKFENKFLFQEDQVQSNKHLTKAKVLTKANYSIIFMVIAGPSYECFHLDMGTNKRLNDAEVWEKKVKYHV